MSIIALLSVSASSLQSSERKRIAVQCRLLILVAEDLSAGSKQQQLSANRKTKIYSVSSRGAWMEKSSKRLQFSVVPYMDIEPPVSPL